MSSSVSTPRSTTGDAKAAAADVTGEASARASPFAVPSVMEAPELAKEAGNDHAATEEELEEQEAAVEPPTPPESPMSPPREISPVSAKILAAEAGKMQNAKSTYKTPTPILGIGFGAFDYEPPAPEDRPAGPTTLPVVAALQDSPRPGSVRQLSATYSAAVSLSRTASNTSEESRLRGVPFRAHSADGSDSLNDAADAATARAKRRSSLGVAPLVADPVATLEAAGDGDDDDDFGMFEDADGAAAAELAAVEDTAADDDGFGTFEDAEPPGAAEGGAETTAEADVEEGFADFEEASGGDDDGFGDFDAAPAAAMPSEPSVRRASPGHLFLLTLPL